MGDSLYNIIYILYSLGIVLSAICVVLVVFQKPSGEQKITTLIAVFCAIIWMGYWGSIQAESEALLVYANQVKYLGACNIYFVLLLFYAKYHRIKIRKPIFYFLFLFSIILTSIIVTFDKHTLYYKSYYMDTNGIFPTLVKEYGVFHNLYILMVIGYTIAFIILYIFKVRRDKTTKKTNSVILFLVILIPSIFYVIEKIIDPIVDIVPFGLLITNIFLIYLIIKGKICDVNSLARELIFNSIDDALIVVDNKLQFIEANTLAKHLFPELQGYAQNEKINKISPSVSNILENKINRDDGNDNYKEYEDKIYESRLKVVQDKNKINGYVLWLEDVTAQRNNLHLLQNYQENLEKDVSKKTIQLQKMQEQMVYGFAALVENKNMVTGGHIKRTSEYVIAIARELKKEGLFKDILSDSYLDKLRLVAPLHDIGKVTIPEIILDKPGKLTEEEFETIKTHSKNGANIIDYTMSENEDKVYFEMAKEVAHYHHEKWNGKGYPDGLVGEEIPLDARIMAVADVFDALVSERPYKKAFSMDRAFQIIEEESGEHFDPMIVKAFHNIRIKIEKLHKELCDK